MVAAPPLDGGRLFNAPSRSGARRPGTAPVGSTGPTTTGPPGPRPVTASRSARGWMPSPRPRPPSSPGRKAAGAIDLVTRARAGLGRTREPGRVQRGRHRRQGGRDRRRDEAGRRLRLARPGRTWAGANTGLTDRKVQSLAGGRRGCSRVPTGMACSFPPTTAGAGGRRTPGCRRGFRS